jgi:hypothetical protein
VRIDRLSHVVGARTDILLLNWSTSLRLDGGMTVRDEERAR